MTTQREHKARWKANHIKTLELLGFKASQFNRLRAIENRANWNATQWANGDIDSDQYQEEKEKIVVSVSRLLGYKLPPGFFVNSDPRGYALKIELETEEYKYSDYYTDDELRGLHKDWGGYGILAPEF